MNTLTINQTELGRFKKVLSPDMVAHKWANQLQSEARNSGNTFYFDGESIYSYGRHFCIAKHVINERGERAVLFTTRSYSSTTTGHKSIVRNASSHLNIIYCNDPSEGTYQNLEAFKANIKGLLSGLRTAKKPEKYIHPAESVYNQCIKYCEFFNIEIPSDITELIESAKSGKYAEYLAQEAERIEKERQEAEAKRIKQFKKDLAKWRKGETQRLYGRIDRDYLRFNGKRIETSQNVEIPLEVAKRAFNWILSTITNGGCLGECNYKILDFEVKEVNKDFIKIGCHTIDIKEIKSIAKKLNW